MFSGGIVKQNRTVMGQCHMLLVENNFQTQAVILQI